MKTCQEYTPAVERVISTAVTVEDGVAVYAGTQGTTHCHAVSLEGAHANAPYKQHKKIKNKLIQIQTNLNAITGGFTMLRTFTIACIAAVATIFSAPSTADAQPYVIYSSPDDTIVNGWWDSTATEADQLGEMTFELAGVFGGIPLDSIKGGDSIIIDSAYAFSSLESLLVADTIASAYDTMWFQYHIQNQGNVTDSFMYTITLVDTADSQAFYPARFEIFETDSTTLVPGTVSSDSLTKSIKLGLAQDAHDSLLVRLVIPGPLTASDKDTLRFVMNVKDHLYSGVDDAWPGNRIVLDTLGAALHTKNGTTGSDTLLDHGDNQSDTIFIAIAAPLLRLSKKVEGATLPGDTLLYTIRYDNDGSAETRDTVNIVDILPAGVSFLGIDSLALDTARVGVIDVDYRYATNVGWNETEPTTPESLNRVTALRFQIPEGIGANFGTDNQTSLVANDSLDMDAGTIRFKVRIR